MNRKGSKSRQSSSSSSLASPSAACGCGCSGGGDTGPADVLAVAAAPTPSQSKLLPSVSMVAEVPVEVEWSVEASAAAAAACPLAAGFIRLAPPALPQAVPPGAWNTGEKSCTTASPVLEHGCSSCSGGSLLGPHDGTLASTTSPPAAAAGCTARPYPTTTAVLRAFFSSACDSG